MLEGRLEYSRSVLENRAGEYSWALGLKPSPLYQPMMGPGLEPPTPKRGQMARNQAWPGSLSPRIVVLAPVL